MSRRIRYVMFLNLKRSGHCDWRATFVKVDYRITIKVEDPSRKLKHLFTWKKYQNFFVSNKSIRSPIKLNQDVPPVPVCRGTVASIHSYTQHQNFCWRLPRSIEVESFFYNKVESFIVATSVTAHKSVYICSVTDQLGALIIGFFHSIHLTSTPKS